MNEQPNRSLSHGAELKRNYNRFLGFAFLLSVAFHMAIVVLLPWLNEGAGGPVAIKLPEIPRPRDTIMMEIRIAADDSKPGMQGGGAQDAKEPPGKAQKGSPEATPDRTHDRPDPRRNVDVKNPDRIRPVERTEKPEVAGDRRDTSKASAVNGTRGQNPNGTGDRPAGGSGGLGVGVGSASGMGGRGWLVRPRATYPGGTNATGTVKLRFTVLPNGDITNITPVKRADQSLVNAAMAGLRRAKARPLPDDVPQVAQTAVIPFTFELR